MDETTPKQTVEYKIRIHGLIPERWSAWFEGLSITHVETGETVISGPVRDQAALHGLIDKVHDLNLILISVERITPYDQNSNQTGSDI